MTCLTSFALRVMLNCTAEQSTSMQTYVATHVLKAVAVANLL